MMLRTLSYLLLLQSLVLGETTARNQHDSRSDDYGDLPPSRYRRRAMQRVTALGDFIYFMGGELSEYEDGELYDSATHSSRSLNSTMVVPHSESWDVATLEFNFIEDSPPSVNTFALWHDTEDHLYRWGGSVSRGGNISEDDVRLWEFEADGSGSGDWDTSDQANDQTFDDILATTGGAHTSCGRKGFWIGGVGRGATDSRLAELSTEEPLPLPGILTYDMTTRQWSNDSTAPLSPPHGIIVESAAACAQGFPLDPLIVSLGGANTSLTNAKDDVSTIDMGNITFWDPESKRWHWQVATGDVPSGRQSACVAGAQSTDGTYEIFMYGGLSSYGTRNDMYVLSLPGFRWFNIDVDSPTRMYHACATVGKRQMLSTGGLTREWDWESQDPWVHAMRIFDMTALEWKDSFDAHADDYQSPQMVKDWYKDGGLDDVEWSHDAVKAMFIDEDGHKPGSGSDSNDGNDSSANTSAIAGGVVGGVAGLGIIGALIWFVCRRRRQNRAEKLLDASTPERENSHHELPARDGGGSCTSPSTHLADGSDYGLSSGVTSSRSPNPGPVELENVEQERYELPDNQTRTAEMQG